MFKRPPNFTTGQELATRYWWNITQLAAVASQDIFLIVYSSMDDTDEGTKSIHDYCLENGKQHVTKELIEEGYDKEKLTSNPGEVFFDLQLTRKVMDKVLVEDENRDILEKIRKKIRWLTHQRNEVCHEMLTSLDLLNLKLKLGNLKGVIRQLYNLASQFSQMDKEATDTALEFFLDELNVHRSITAVTSYKSQRRFRHRHKRRFVESEEDSSENEEDPGENYSNSSEDQWPSPKDRNVSISENETNSESHDNAENMYCKNELNMHSVGENTQRHSEQQTSFTNPYTEGTFQEIWQAKGPTLLVQVGLYCSKGWQNQFGNFQTVLPSGEQFMLFWQQCQCEDHLIEEIPSKVKFVPPKLDVRTRSKSLGRRASRYILNRQRLSRKKYKAKRDRVSQENRSLWNILNQVEVCVPETQKGVFGNRWEDAIRREEAIVAIENWDILLAEEEWINDGWIDIQDSKAPSKGNASTKEPGCIYHSECSKLFSSEIRDCYSMKTKKIFFTSASIIFLISVLTITSGFLVILVAFLVVAFIGKLFTEILNILAAILLLCNLGCVVFVVFLIAEFLLIVLVSMKKITSVFLLFIHFCAVLEQRSSEAVQRLNHAFQQ